MISASRCREGYDLVGRVQRVGNLFETSRERSQGRSRKYGGVFQAQNVVASGCKVEPNVVIVRCLVSQNVGDVIIGFVSGLENVEARRIHRPLPHSHCGFHHDAVYPSRNCKISYGYDDAAVIQRTAPIRMRRNLCRSTLCAASSLRTAAYAHSSPAACSRRAIVSPQSRATNSNLHFLQIAPVRQSHTIVVARRSDRARDCRSISRRAHSSLARRMTARAVPNRQRPAPLSLREVRG